MGEGASDSQQVDFIWMVVKKALGWFSCLDQLAILMLSRHNLWVPVNKNRNSSVPYSNGTYFYLGAWLLVGV